MDLWPVGVSRDLVVIMIGRWSEANAPTTFHDVMGARLGEQKEMSGDDGRKLAWWGMCVCFCGSLRM